MNRGMEAAQSFTSPLAQIFQPLVVDDDLPVADDQSQDGNGNGAPLVSYGPTTRRRLTSIQGAGHRRGTSDFGGARQGNSNLSPPPHHQFPNRHGQRSPQHQQGFPSMQEVMSGVDGVLSESPGSVSTGGPGGADLPTAGQVQEEEGSAGGSPQWGERLDKMEERQERIEKLLESIARDLKESRGS